MLLFKAELLHIKVLFLQQQRINKCFWGWCFFCFAALPKQFWLPGMAQHSPCWDVIALCWSMKVVYGDTGRQGQRKSQPRTRVLQGHPLPQSPPVCLPLAWLGVPVVSCRWLGSLWPGGVPKSKDTAACMGESHGGMVSLRSDLCAN